MQTDCAAILARALQSLRTSGTAAAGEILRAEYPFVPVALEGRRYTELQSLQVFVRDGFVDRYSGQRLVFPGVLRLLSRLLPQEFPFHPNWKMTETHPAYWELFPTIDHVLPVARGGPDSEAGPTARRARQRGGPDSEANWVTTSMLRNAAKANWRLEELGWSLHPPGSLTDWDGLTKLFLELVDSDRSLLEDAYLRRWHTAIVRAGASRNKPLQGERHEAAHSGIRQDGLSPSAG